MAGSLVVGLVLVQVVLAENWSSWRGPRGDGTSLESNAPLRWSATDNVAWKRELRYHGHSSPITWGNRLFFVGANVDPARDQSLQGGKRERALLCLDRKTGRELWKRIVVESLLETKHGLNSWASSTPATDGTLVYVTFLEVDGRTIDARNVSTVRPVTPGMLVVAAYDFDGNRRWIAKPGEFCSVHGFCSCPVLYQDKVIVNGDHDGKGYIVALDRKTGRTIWKTPRDNQTRSYCTPIIRTVGGQTQLMLSGSISIASYNPDDGGRLWHMQGPTEQFVASPAFSHGLLFITGGYPDHHILTIDPRGRGDITDSAFIRWRHRTPSLTSYVPSPTAVGVNFFVVSDHGFGSCYDATSGTIRWQRRMGRRYSASLIATPEHVYCLDDDGICKVIKAEPSFELVATNKLGEPTSASMVISDGQLLIRSEKHLFCIGEPNAAVGGR